MELREWIDGHGAISLHWLENKLGLKGGTFRKGKDIPKKYREGVERLLFDYGYDCSVEPVKRCSDGKVYVIKNGALGQINDGLFVRVILDNDTKLQEVK